MNACEPKNDPPPPARRRRGLSRSVVLVGLMGAGKTTIGRRLAKRLGLEFVDADEAIEEAAGLTVSEIFARYGEAHFREGERRVIARLISGMPKVIATGGGAFVDPETRARVLETAIAVWLDADIDTLVERVAKRDHRPLLKDKDAGQVLRDLAAVRNPFYAQAPIRISSQPAPHHVAVDSIVAELRRLGEAP